MWPPGLPYQKIWSIRFFLLYWYNSRRSKKGPIKGYYYNLWNRVSYIKPYLFVCVIFTQYEIMYYILNRQDYESSIQRNNPTVRANTTCWSISATSQIYGYYVWSPVPYQISGKNYCCLAVFKVTLNYIPNWQNKINWLYIC